MALNSGEDEMTSENPWPRPQLDCGTLPNALEDSPRHLKSSERSHVQHTPGDGSVSAIIGATTEDNYSEGFYGSSSAGTFMQKVKKLVEHKLCEERPTKFHGDRDLPYLLASGRTSGGQHLDYVLPSRRYADTLMATYWKYVHVLYPYLDEAQMKKDYESIWKGQDSVVDERSFLCLLNAIFAISCQLIGLTVSGEREESANVFYLRARKQLDVVEMPSLRSVQSYLLLGLYFQSTNEPHPCWIFVGLAIRTAQSLGLHLPETSERVRDLRTREMLRKVWYGCVLTDRVLCMTYGRPCMIGPVTATVVPLPLAIDEDAELSEEVQHNVGQVRQRPSLNEFYLSALKLYEIMHDVLFSFYRTDDQVQSIVGLYGKGFGGSSAPVFELDQKLSMWEKNLPDHLKIESRPRDDDVEAIFYRQATVLHQRYARLKLFQCRVFPMC